MRLAKKTAGAILLGLMGGAACGAVISVVATAFGPHAPALEWARPAEVLGLAVAQGILVGALVGPVLVPLAFFALEQRTRPRRIALITGSATLLAGSAFGLVAGPAAGLAGGILGFFTGVVLLSPPSLDARQSSRLSVRS